MFVTLLTLSCASNTISKIQTPQDISSQPPKGLMPVSFFGQTSLGSTGLNHPQGITIDFQGNLYITDTGNDRIIKCDSLGNFLKEIGGFGWGESQFNRPTYITVDQGLNIYVVDTQNRRVQKFNRELNYISTIRIESDENQIGFGLLQGITITPGGEMILSDTEQDCLLRLDNFEKYKSRFAGFEYGEGSVLDPMGLCTDDRGNIYAADSRRNRIAVYDPFGNYLKSVGEKFLNNPQGVAVDKDGYIYVANTGMNTLVIFDSEGGLVLTFGGEGKEINRFSRPTDIKVRNKLVYVVDSDNNRVQILQLFK